MLRAVHRPVIAVASAPTCTGLFVRSGSMRTEPSPSLRDDSETQILVSPKADFPLIGAISFRFPLGGAHALIFRLGFLGRHALDRGHDLVIDIDRSAKPNRQRGQVPILVPILTNGRNLRIVVSFAGPCMGPGALQFRNYTVQSLILCCLRPDGF